MKYELPKLSYAYDALEPYIDARTMEIHYTKHHQAYANKLNEALDKHPEIADKPLDDLLFNLGAVPEDVRTAVRDYGGGYANHSFFWTIMGPESFSIKTVANIKKEPSGALAQEINGVFGDFAKFKEIFTKTAASVFGSGWAWLVIDKNKKLIITSTANQDSPLINNKKPLLCLDVWEHAYYLKHNADRKGYIEDWWNVVNWEAVDAKFKETA